MMRRHRHRHGPPWWPSNEPWPPQHRKDVWRHGRARFVRRIALFVGAILLLSTVGAATLISAMLRRAALGGLRLEVAPILMVSVTGIVFVGLLAVAGRRLVGPLGNIMEAANRVADGDYSARVALHGPPPVRMVGGAFNSMAEKLETQDRQRRHLMADIAHELRTPLTVIQGRLEGLLDGVYARDDEQLEQLADETRTLSRLVEDLRTLAHTESGMLSLQKEPTDLAALAQEVVSALSGEAERRRVAVELDAPQNLPLLSVDPLRVREVIVNLLSNALRHSPEGGRVSVVLTSIDERIAVAVTDAGSGIPADQLPKIFDRFYKGPESKGSGLGLTIARNLVAAHGGEIRAESRVGAGTTITFIV